MGRCKGSHYQNGVRQLGSDAQYAKNRSYVKGQIQMMSDNEKKNLKSRLEDKVYLDVCERTILDILKECVVSE